MYEIQRVIFIDINLHIIKPNTDSFTHMSNFVQVNWTPKLTTQTVLQGRLPAIKLPTLVADAKYCQVSLTDGSGIQNGFNVRLE